MLSDVTRAAGVSQQTVLRALNNKAEISPETRARILQVVEQLGYRPSLLARGLATHKTTTLGPVVPDIANPFSSLVNRRLPESGLTSICVDDERGARDAVQHLIHRERRCIALLAGPPASRSGHSRRCGYATALEAAGRPLDDGLIQPCAPDLEGGRKAATVLLLARPEIDALFCYNDLVSVGVLQACAACGRRVPEDVAVIGCDEPTWDDHVKTVCAVNGWPFERVKRMKGGASAWNWNWRVACFLYHDAVVDLEADGQAAGQRRARSAGWRHRFCVPSAVAGIRRRVTGRKS